jgi:2-polyprenyl-3-methyl-5-hydroxy-6-metoxy-1,4-benzoquinol methylase
MTLLSDHGAAPLRTTSPARDLARKGPQGTASPGSGRPRRVFRRFLLRLLKPYIAYQQMMDDKLLDAIDRIESRLAQGPQQLEQLTEDLLEATDTLRSRIEAGDDVIAGSRAVPYTGGDVLEQFRDPFGGVVLGYRNGGGTDGAVYAAFEDVFRGPEERVRERQSVYVDLLKSHAPILDAGCGRGEFLDVLREAGLTYAGVDTDAGMVERCHAKGHAQVALDRADTYLEGLAEDSLGAVFSAQVIEHLPYPELNGFLRLSKSRLRPGGIFVAETVNPHAPHALKTFWVDPTHQHPLFPEVVLVLCRIAGFASAYVFHPLGTGHVEDDRYRESAYAVVATKA